MTILLVRHAHAGDRGSWKGDDRARPLDKRGRAQAEALAPLLASFEPTKVLSSPSNRCVETVAPAAKRVGLKIKETDALCEGNSKEAISLVESLVSGPSVVLCSHGDVIPDVLDALAAKGMTGWVGTCKKGSLWVIDTRRARFKEARYYPPQA